MPPDPVACFHCGEACLDETHHRTVENRGVSLCCHGCAAALDWIQAQGLDRFYAYRDRPTAKPEERADWSLFDDPGFIQAYTFPLPEGVVELELSIPQIRCAACTWLLERILAATEGVIASHAHLARQTLTLRYRPDTLKLAPLLAQLDGLGYSATVLTDEKARHDRRQARRQLLKRIGVAGLGSMQVMMFATALYVGDTKFIEEGQRQFLRWVSLLVSIPVLFYSAAPFFQGAFRDLRHRTLGMDVPVALALGLAWCASVIATLLNSGEVYFDSVAMFTLFLLTGRAIELHARHRVIDTPVEARPMPLTLAVRGSTGIYRQTPVHQIKPGDHIQLASGQQTPVDFRLNTAQAVLDTQALTGEFTPVERVEGDEILAGSVNGPTPVQGIVIRIGQQAFLGRLNHLVRQAESVKPPETRWIEPVLRVFIATVLGLSGLTALLWWPTDPERAFSYALSVLVVTCPCALALAIPTAWTASIHALRKQGILLLNPTHLRAFATAKTWFFDKTGTLTEGRFERLTTHTVPTAGYQTEVLLSVVSGLELSSAHPIAEAFTDIAPAIITDPTSHPGLGVSGVWEGHQVRVESARPDEWLSDYPDALQICLRIDGQMSLVVALDDRLRSDAKAALARLKGHGIETRLISGDRIARVKTVAAAVGIIGAEGELTPERKLNRLSKTPGPRVMVGDGLNDSPVLAAAEGSITFTHAADLTRYHAGAVLLNPRLEALNQLREQSIQTRAVIRQSMTWVFIYNGIAVPFAMAGMVPPWLAAIGMSLSSLGVLLNAMRLSR
ncbi:MAG: heavy metal translocating P-type ATPase [Gammaproteobacteria bacterium]|nr:heavy metal translocating P-type ATPase [Gammaproteobacteria bacterium]